MSVLIKRCKRRAKPVKRIKKKKRVKIILPKEDIEDQLTFEILSDSNQSDESQLTKRKVLFEDQMNADFSNRNNTSNLSSERFKIDQNKIMDYYYKHVAKSNIETPNSQSKSPLRITDHTNFIKKIDKAYEML